MKGITLTLMFLSNKVAAFTAFKASNYHHQHASRITTTPPLGASIYYPDDDGGTYRVDEETDIFGFTDTLSSGMSYIFDPLAAQLTSDPTITSTLARLASRYSPPGFDINLELLNEVRLQSLDNTKIEIEAVVCDETECSALLVPVTFPEECIVDEYLQECVLRNVHHLDDAGETIMEEKKEYQPNAPSVSLPSWWVSPTSPEDLSEVELIKDLLNGRDFQDVIRGLAMIGLDSNEMNENQKLGYFYDHDMIIGTVRVDVVGPKGLVMLVQISGFRYEDEVTVPIKFSRDEGSIRDKVLNHLASSTADKVVV